MALRLAGVKGAELEKYRLAYTVAILVRQSESGSFRFPGWEFKWPKSKPYASESWIKDLAYGRGWNEVMITAQCVYGLGLPKSYLPAFNLWKDQ